MGCPIRTLQDHSLVTGSLGLFAGSCVLHRLSTPSHPPCTLVPGHTNRTPCFLLRFHTRTASSPRRCIRTSSRLPPHPRLRLDEPEVRPASIDRFINLWHYKIIFPTRIQPASCDLGRSGQHFFTTCSPSTPNRTCVRSDWTTFTLATDKSARSRVVRLAAKNCFREVVRGRTIVCIRLSRKASKGRLSRRKPFVGLAWPFQPCRCLVGRGRV